MHSTGSIKRNNGCVLKLGAERSTSKTGSIEYSYFGYKYGTFLLGKNTHLKHSTLLKQSKMKNQP